MSIYKTAELFKHLAAKKLKPVYLLAGEETFSHHEAVQAIAGIINAGPLNTETFTIPDDSLESVLTALHTVPFLAESRLIIVREAHKLRAPDVESLAESLEKPVPSACLVLLWPSPLKRDAKGKLLAAACEKNGVVAECWPFFERDLPGWIVERFRRGKKKIAPEAIPILIQEAGTSLQDLANEIEKLMLYAGPAQEITPEIVEHVSGHTRVASLNQLAEAIELRNGTGALKIIEELLGEGEEGLRIVATMHRVIRRCAAAKSMQEEEGRSDNDIRSSLHLNVFFDRSFFDRLKRHSLGELERGLHKIVQADFELKSSSRPDTMVLEELALSLFQARNQA